MIQPLDIQATSMASSRTNSETACLKDAGPIKGRNPMKILEAIDRVPAKEEGDGQRENQLIK